MKNWVKNQFALTERGAGDLIKASAASFLIYIINLFPAMLLMLLLDQLLMEHVRDKSLYIILSVGVLVIMFFLLKVEYNALYSTTYRESANLRIETADRLSKLPLSYFYRHDLSDLSQTIMSDVAAIEHAMSHAMAKVIGFLLFFPLISILLLIGNVTLGLAVILPIVLGILLIVWSKKIQLRHNLKYYKKLRDNSESFQETIENEQEIKSFGLSDAIKKSLYKKMDESEKIHLKTEVIAAVPLLLSGLVIQLTFVIVIIMGTQMILHAQISLLYFIGYILASIKIKDAVDGVSENLTELYYLDSMIKRIKDIKDTKVQEGTDSEIPSYDIKLDHVSFSYSKDTQVLSDVSFTANQNEVTALVGMSGCGKTSILRLISRLYDYDGGTIEIGGVDIKKLSTKALFSKISIVFQDVTLFNTSVLENIRIGNKAATDEEVIAAARLANCEEFIEKLPDGYHTSIKENGASLSGGERQRLSIARAFLKDAPIIILDEIAAALDVDNEKKIQDSLNKLIENKTVIIISHRLKSVENVNKIVVIDGGKVESFGKHQALMKSSKIYNNLVGKAKLAEEYTY